MIPVKEAIEKCRKVGEPLESERVPLRDVVGRVSPAEVCVPEPIPPFDQSAMDGYAVSASDLEAAAPDNPVELQLGVEITPGRAESLPVLESGDCFRIFTGSVLPDGADAVVKQEDVGVRGQSIVFQKSVTHGHNIRPPGTFYSEGEPIVSANQRIDSRDVAKLAECGVSKIRVRRRPQIHLLTTGDEVVSPDQALRPGQIYDANTPFIEAWLSRRGYTVSSEHLEDDPDVVERSLARSLASADLVITTGGVSVGDYDFIVDTADKLDVETVFWKVAQKPGKPLFVGRRDGTVLIGLPGNPYSAQATAPVYLPAILDSLEGVEDPRPVWGTGRLDIEVERRQVRSRWVHCRIGCDEAGNIELVSPSVAPTLPRGMALVAPRSETTEKIDRVPFAVL